MDFAFASEVCSKAFITMLNFIFAKEKGSIEVLKPYDKHFIFLIYLK